MNDSKFSDYYEVMEVSPNATPETIERMFRFLGQRLHPDNAQTGDDARFRVLLDAYSALRDPEKRAAYDVRYRAAQKQMAELKNASETETGDSADRHRLLTLFYSQRRRNMKSPGIGSSTLERMMACPAEVLEFHLWYFREKGWIKREESGLYSITADGIDRIESSDQRVTATDRLLTVQLAGNKTVANVDAKHSTSSRPSPHVHVTSPQRK